MKRCAFILFFITIFTSCFAKGTIEDEIEVCLKRALSHKTEKNVRLLFNALNKWEFKNYYEFSSPYLKENGLITANIITNYALKGDNLAIKLLLKSVNILILTPDNAEFSESLSEDVNCVIRKHFVKTVKLIMKLDENHQKSIIEMLKSPVSDNFDYNELLKLAKKYKINKEFINLVNKNFSN